MSRAKHTPKKAKEQISEVRILEALQELDMTQSELADRTGILPNHLSQIVSGKRKCISLPIALKISIVLDKPVDELFIFHFSE